MLAGRLRLVLHLGSEEKRGIRVTPGTQGDVHRVHRSTRSVCVWPSVLQAGGAWDVQVSVSNGVQVKSTRARNTTSHIRKTACVFSVRVCSVCVCGM